MLRIIAAVAFLVQLSYGNFSDISAVVK